MLRKRDPPGFRQPPTLRAGDGVRLKFVYPGGAVEILDCTWIALVGLGATGSEALSQWVVIEFRGRKIWKPLGHLVQAEVLEDNDAPVAPTNGGIPRTTEDLGYLR